MILLFMLSKNAFILYYFIMDKKLSSFFNFSQSVKYGERELKNCFSFLTNLKLYFCSQVITMEIKRLQKMLFYIGLLTNLYVKINSV